MGTLRRSRGPTTHRTGFSQARPMLIGALPMQNVLAIASKYTGPLEEHHLLI